MSKLAHSDQASMDKIEAKRIAFENDTRCPTCRAAWWLNPPVKCDGDNDAYRCIECKAIYTAPMLAATDMLTALELADEAIILLDGEVSCKSILKSIRAAVHKATVAT